MGVAGTIGIILSAVGSGLSYSAQMSAARTHEQFSLLNAEAGVQQATQQANLAALQSQLQGAKSDAAARAAADNANAVREQTEVESRVAQENIRRGRDEFARKLAVANAQAAGSGVDVSTGSPLDLLIKASDDQDMLEAEQQWYVGIGRDRGMRQAAAVELGGRVEGLNAALYDIEGQAALAEGRMRASQARLGGLAGQATADGMRGQAIGGLFGSLGNLGIQGAQLWEYGRRR